MKKRIQKLLKRRNQFKTKVPGSWTQGRREAVQYMLSKQCTYMSSEESGEDDESKVLIRRPLTWLKSKYQRSLRELDQLSYKSLSSKGKQMYMKRIVGEPSCRPQPEGIPPQLLAEDSVTADTSIEE